MKGAISFLHHADSGIVYHGSELGEGNSLLFLHGFTGCHAAYPELMDLLARNFKVISVDLPGHGNTELPNSLVVDFSNVVHDLAEILNIRGQETPHCVGYSMGGRIALALACMHPGAVGALSLIGASPGIACTEERKRRLARDRDLASFIEKVPKSAFLDYWSKLPLFALEKPRVSGRVLKRTSKGNKDTNLARSLSLLGPGVQPSFWDCLPKLTLPIQLIVGCMDRKFLQVARDMKSQLSNSRLDFVPSANHRVHVDQPDRAASLITAHLTSFHLEQPIR